MSYSMEIKRYVPTYTILVWNKVLRSHSLILMIL
jgi:hypothetical protein